MQLLFLVSNFFYRFFVILDFFTIYLLKSVAAMQDRTPFMYRDAVTWSEVAGLLNSLFIYHTGRGLPMEQLDYLATIALSW